MKPERIQIWEAKPENHAAWNLEDADDQVDDPAHRLTGVYLRG